jgi:predicted DNA-binding transcriptional regulator AlpA
MSDQILLLDTEAVLRRTGLPRRTFFHLRERGEFPKPLHWSTCKRHVAWHPEDIERWCRDRDGDITRVLNPFMRSKSETDLTPVSL